jgi:hypothetical protein
LKTADNERCGEDEDPYGGDDGRRDEDGEENDGKDGGRDGQYDRDYDKDSHETPPKY